ncbi:MAG TPA: hypothetical protein VM470_02515 [Acidimicrobiia bacterium]|nr:hypothetical protein [Acidimicrobiia bacterium]
MTAPWSRPHSGWPLGAGAFLAAVLIAGGVGVTASILSPALGLDLISLWPGLVPALLAAILVTIRGAWRRRFGALPFLLVLTWLGLGSAAHFDGWPPLPSSAAELHGPGTVDGQVALSANIGGAIEVMASNRSHLYEVQFIRRGGEVGIPEAEEITLGDQVSIELIESGRSTWLRYAGWRLLLSTATTWDLHLSGQPIDADLSALEVSSISVEGEGRIVLGSPIADSVIAVGAGEFELNLPASAPVRLIGSATVPADWEAVEGGFESPEKGPAWLITVVRGATVRIVEA